jgi:hypothetical protein
MCGDNIGNTLDQLSMRNLHHSETGTERFEETTVGTPVSTPEEHEEAIGRQQRSAQTTAKMTEILSICEGA